MKIIVEELQNIQAKLLAIDVRLAAMLSDATENSLDSDSIELLDKAFNLLQQELLEIHKLESIITARKIALLEQRIKLTKKD